MLAEVAMATNHWGFKAIAPMTDEQFRLWQTLIEARTGMTVGESRRSYLETSVGIRMRELGLADHEAYYEQLLSGPSSEPEWATLVNRLTVQETSFFRHASSYELVRSYVESLLVMEPGRKSVNVWSVGCSTGEEPYSLAMQLDAQLSESGRQGVFYGITASDISLPTLAKARRGVYPHRRLQNVPLAWQEAYFEQVSPAECQVVQRLRDRICFVQMNIMQLDNVPLFDMDVIYCQNVLIYFRRFRKRDIVSNLAERLRPGGLLVLGVNEMVDWHHPLLERVSFPDTLAFRRKCD